MSNPSQEAVENLELGDQFDVDTHGKLHVLYGGTKVVQHTPPSKTGPGLKGYYLLSLYEVVCMPHSHCMLLVRSLDSCLL